jgi:hypothetical protein
MVAMKGKVLVTVVLLTAGITWAQSPRAVIRELRGTVETRAPGSAEWRTAAAGEELEGETMVSTGFKSAAVIALGDSLVQVRPLTRLSLGELAAAAGTEKVEIRLRAGRIRADVKAPAAGGRTEFTVRSPVATASVRGTVFDFDTVNLRVGEGTVSFSGADNTVVYVGAGQSSALDSASGGRAAAAMETAAAQSPPPPAGVDAVAPPSPAVIPAVISPVNVGIRWE